MIMILLVTLAKDYEISRDHLQLQEIIGQGQFGDVYKGSYRAPVFSPLQIIVLYNC